MFPFSAYKLSAEGQIFSSSVPFSGSPNDPENLNQISKKIRNFQQLF